MMRPHFWLGAILLSGCSLIANPLDRHTFDRDRDAGSSQDAGMRPDGDAPRDGGRDAGQDTGVDAGPPPGTPTLRAPWNGYRTGSALTATAAATRNALRPQLRWEPVDDAITYEIELSASCDVAARSTCAFDDAIRGSTPDTSWRPDAPLAVSSARPVGTRYAWRVRACAGACGEWSEVRYLDVGRLAGDFNGDGYGDAAAGASGQDGPAVDDGIAYVFLSNGTEIGPDPSVTLASPRPGTSTRFGQSLASAGDVNGDGFDDLTAGADLQDRAYVYYGASSGVPASPSAPIANPLGIAAGFGFVVAPAGDLNGDGYADVAIGAPRHDDTETREGSVFVFFGSADGLGTAPLRIANPSPQPSSEFGTRLAGGADIDGDGLTDLVVTASRHDGTAMDEGVAYVFRGTATGVEATPWQTIPSPAPMASGRFGSHVALGDATNDGFADIVLLAASPDNGYVLTGSREGLGAPVELARPSTDGVSSTVAFVGDVNGDGFGDFALGRPTQDAPTNDEGVIVLFLGAADVAGFAASGRVFAHPEPQWQAEFGFSVGGGSDANGDGFSEIVVGAVVHDLPEMNEGAVYVLRGSAAGLGGVLGAAIDNPSDQPGSTFGLGVARCY